MSKTWSPLQTAIFNLIEDPNGGNAIIEAVAGSGKTTTIVEGVKRARGTTIFLAFNKSIAEELKSRGVNARTFHSLTYGPVTQHKGVRTVEIDKLRRLCDAKLKGEEAQIYGAFIAKLVGLGRQAGIGCLIPDVTQSWLDLCIHHDLEPENDNADLGRALELASELLGWSNAAPMVDFDDLLYLAVKDGISLPKFDFIFVDEAQDTNAIQRALLRKIMKKTSRVVAVGDPAQAIYGFRGADSESMNLIAEEFDCKRLPLAISYRCATSVVKYAQQWVPHIQAAEGAVEGLVEELGSKWDHKMFQANDLVVSRKTAPLITMAYSFLRARVPVTVMGREIGQGLKGLINKMNAKGVDHLLTKLDAYRDREVEKTTADILGPHCAAAQALKDAERRRAAGETVEFFKADHSIVVRGTPAQLTLRDRTTCMLSGNKKLGRHLLTSAGQYKEAINVECPFCCATVGNRCTGVVFPQYPHTARIESALGLESGAWESMPIDAFEQMQG